MNSEEFLRYQPVYVLEHSFRQTLLFVLVMSEFSFVANPYKHDLKKQRQKKQGCKDLFFCSYSKHFFFALEYLLTVSPFYLFSSQPAVDQPTFMLCFAPLPLSLTPPLGLCLSGGSGGDSAW